MSVAAAGFLAAIQVGTRASVFLLNILVARQASPYVYGLVSIQLHLLYSSILFLAREPVRLVTLRHPQAGEPLTYSMTLPLGIALASILPMLFPEDIPRYALAGYGVSALIELLAEVYFLRLRRDMPARARVEAMAMGIRCIITYTTTGYGILHAFILGQLAYSCACALGYWWEAPPPPAPSTTTTPIPHSLARGFLLQSIEKHLLTEGEKLVLTALHSSSGEYALVSNLGSLVARIILQPLEEAYSMEFGGLTGPPLLTSLARGWTLAMTLGCTAVAFAPAYSYTALHLLYGSTWSAGDAPGLLSLYSWYILCMALNGVSEGFVLATMPSTGLPQYNKVLVLYSVVYLTLGVMAVHDTRTLILVNCLNMLCRVVYNLWYIRGLFPHGLARLYRVLPSIAGPLLVCRLVTGYSHDMVGSLSPLHVMTGACCLLLTVGVLHPLVLKD